MKNLTMVQKTSRVEDSNRLIYLTHRHCRLDHRLDSYHGDFQLLEEANLDRCCSLVRGVR